MKPDALIRWQNHVATCPQCSAHGVIQCPDARRLYLAATIESRQQPQLELALGDAPSRTDLERRKTDR